MNTAIKDLVSKLGDIIESKAFISIAAVLTIAYGLWYWGDFSNHVDEVAKQLSSKMKQKEHSVEIDLSYWKIRQIVLRKADFNIYSFAEYKSKMYSKEMKKSSNVNYKIVIDSLENQLSRLSFKYMNTKVDRTENDSLLIQLRSLIMNSKLNENL